MPPPVANFSSSFFFVYLRCNTFVLQKGWGPFLGWFIMTDSTHPFHAGGVRCEIRKSLQLMVLSKQLSQVAPAVCRQFLWLSNWDYMVKLVRATLHVVHVPTALNEI